jgi:hypothetical protein
MSGAPNRAAAMARAGQKVDRLSGSRASWSLKTRGRDRRFLEMQRVFVVCPGTWRAESAAAIPWASEFPHRFAVLDDGSVRELSRELARVVSLDGKKCKKWIDFKEPRESTLENKGSRSAFPRNAAGFCGLSGNIEPHQVHSLCVREPSQRGKRPGANVRPCAARRHRTSIEAI